MAQLVQFFKEAYAELQKVTWLSRQELIASTIVVMILVVIVSLYVATIDFFLTHILGFILRGI